MVSKAERAARAARQERVSKAIWGLVFVAFGALLFMEDRGEIDLGEPSKFPASHAVDGDEKTRWSSAFRDPEWITVDLGAPADITRVRLVWEKAYATRYEIQVSDDGSRWTTVKEVTAGDGGVDELDVEAKGRYVRMEGKARSTPWGFSLFEFEVHGKDPWAGEATPRLLSAGKRANASSYERPPVWISYWLLFWPVLMIAGGLPLLVAPKDNGEQVFGLVLTGIGVFLQLQKLGHIPWTLSQSWPLLLVIAGILLVTQALGQKGDPSGDDRTSGGGSASGSCW
jgi:F5/8 type C domain/Domain of unknown function (DUF5668)